MRLRHRKGSEDLRGSNGIVVETVAGASKLTRFSKVSQSLWRVLLPHERTTGASHVTTLIDDNGAWRHFEINLSWNNKTLVNVSGTLRCL